MMDKDQILAKWIAGELSDAELKKLVSEDEYSDYLKLRKGISLYEKTQAPLRKEIFENIKTMQKQQRKAKLFKMITAVAAAVLVLFSINYFISPKTFVVETAYGEQQQINLPDGSKVVLGAQSSLSYNKADWENNKIVKLEGNAYFEVKNAGKFTVNTANGKINVLGTKFTINSIDDYLNVKCFEGKVNVVAQQEIVLKPLESLQKIGNNIQKTSVDYQKPLWLSGESRFKSTPLKYVLKTIEKQYGISFIKENIDDNKLFTGSFNHHNLALTLKVVLGASNIKVVKKDAHTYVLKM